MRDQDAARRLQQESVLNPSQALPKAPPPVKDLTMSLMENNLKQISLTGPTLTNPPQQSWPLNPPVAPAAMVAPVAPVNPAPVAAWTNQGWRPAWQPSATPSPMAFPSPQFQLSTNKIPMNSMSTQPSFQPSMMNGMKPSQPAKQLSSTEINDFLS